MNDRKEHGSASARAEDRRHSEPVKLIPVLQCTVVDESPQPPLDGGSYRAAPSSQRDAAVDAALFSCVVASREVDRTDRRSRLGIFLASIVGAFALAALMTWALLEVLYG